MLPNSAHFFSKFLQVSPRSSKDSKGIAEAQLFKGWKPSNYLVQIYMQHWWQKI